MKFIRTLLIVFFPIYFISCSTPKPLPYYLENAADSNINKDVKLPELKIQKNDLLSIQVYSESTQPELSDKLYNLPSVSSTPGQVGSSGSGFLVDVDGNIEYPRLGKLHVEGLTKQQLGNMIKQKINAKDTVLINPSVIVRFLNFKVTMIGQVGKEGPINVEGEKITILEAIGSACGITDYGKKNEVKVIREIDGKREIGIVDLSSKDLFESPYYNLMQNDYVIVYPTKRKAKMEDQNMVTQRISLAIGLITAAAFIYNIFK